MLLAIPLYVKLIPYGLLTPLAIFSSQTRILAATGTALVVLLLIDFYSDTWHHGKMWAHGLIGMLLSRTGYHSTAHTGGVLQVHWTGSLTGVLFFSVVIAVEFYTRRFDQDEPLVFHNFVHMLIYSLGGLLIGVMGIQSWGEQAGWNQTRITNFGFARQLMDPVGVAALGVLLFGHMHDEDVLKKLRHQLFGVIMCILALAQFMCIHTHSSFPFEHAKCRAMRNLHGFCWLLAGVWLYGIGIADVLGPTTDQLDNGVEEPPSMEVIWGSNSGPKSPGEDCSFFITVDLLICAVVMGCRQMTNDSRVVLVYDATETKQYEQVELQNLDFV